MFTEFAFPRAIFQFVGVCRMLPEAQHGVALSVGSERADGLLVIAGLCCPCTGARPDATVFWMVSHYVLHCNGHGSWRNFGGALPQVHRRHPQKFPDRGFSSARGGWLGDAA